MHIRAPEIHAHKEGLVTNLSQRNDLAALESDQRAYKVDLAREFWENLTGDGSSSNPYHGENLLGYGSTHFTAFVFWYFLRRKASEGRVFFIVNDWVFEVVTDGVIAADGVLTSLV